MASCLLCASLKVNRSKGLFSTIDSTNSHVTQHLQQTQLFDGNCIITLDQIFDQCFPNFADTPSIEGKKIVKKEGRQSLLDLCHTIFGGRISKASPRVNCQKCGSGIDLYGKQQKCALSVAIRHASGHLGIDLFECRKCERSFGSERAVQHHLARSHRLRGLLEYFTDRSDDFVDEITTSIKECFVGGKRLSELKTDMIRLKNESYVRSGTKGSKLAVERQLLCYRLIRQFAGDDGKIQCRSCMKRVTVKQRSSYHRVAYTMEHALVHLKKPLYRCEVCTNLHTSRTLMQIHLKSAHALPLTNNYECMADEFHSEIMSMLRKCYEENSGSK